MKLRWLEPWMCCALSMLALPMPRAEAQAAAPVIVQPEPLAMESASYPEAARQLGIAASVLLQLTIDATGAVIAAEVLESGGQAFDDSARDALLRSRFKPATRDGQPLTARIRYRYAFVPPPVPPGVPAVELPRPSHSTALPAVQEVQVRGHVTEAQELEASAEAVTVFDAKRARRESAELGEVLSRIPGVSVRRAGGLGSDERLSLNGLSDNRIATFLDGVPLDMAFFPFGLASFPVSLVDRVEIYKGVVPIRFGADALGGAVNLVTDRRYETGAGAGYELGSFGTQRVYGNTAYRHDDSGFVANAMGFYDYSDNDYEIDVKATDERGRLSPVRASRSHDAYAAGGGTVEAGFVELPWAKRILLRAYSVALDKEVPHNLVMKVPYGEVEYGQTATGATARYEQPLTERLDAQLIASYSYRTATFVDDSQWVYDWFGNRVRERRVRGEIEADPTDQVYRWHNLFGRVVLEQAITPAHVITLVSSPTFTTLTGDERIQSDPAARDPLTAKRVRSTVVSGLEYEANFFQLQNAPKDDELRRAGTDYRLQNLAFVKDYIYRIDSEEPLPRGVFSERDKMSHTLGFGDGVRFRFTRWLLAKASYEYATRLPSADEVFGDGMFVQDNFALDPEVSHNANLGPALRLDDTWSGDYELEVMGFFRQADKLIVLLGSERFFTYQNVWEIRSFGVDISSAWTSPGRYVTLEGSTSVNDLRNVSNKGTFGMYDGDRIPNRPWLFGSWGARLHFEDVLFTRDEIEPFYTGRYVHEYFRGWESLGLRASKEVIPSQLTHSVGLTYVMNPKPATISATFEVQNLGDAKAYDFVGVQKPGRAYYMKLTADLH
jgi:TonB family protein